MLKIIIIVNDFFYFSKYHHIYTCDCIFSQSPNKVHTKNAKLTNRQIYNDKESFGLFTNIATFISSSHKSNL